DPDMISGIQEAVTIPVMAKARIGHFAEAQILQALEIDYIDESEVLTPADLEHHIDKWKFTVPFVCGCTNLGEALRRIAEGSAMTGCSSARASSSRAILRSAPARSSTRRRTAWTETCSRASPPASARRWSASRRSRSIRASCSSAAAGNPWTWFAERTRFKS